MTSTTLALAQAKQQATLDAQTIAEQQQRIGELETQLAAAAAALPAAPAPAPTLPSSSIDDIARAAGEAFAVALTAAMVAPSERRLQCL